MAAPSKRYLTPEQVAELLSIPTATLYKWRYSGTGPPATKVGKYLRFEATELDRWLARCAEQAS